MKIWWRGDKFGLKSVRPEKLALVNKERKQYKILTFSTRRAFFSLALRIGYQEKVSAAP